MWATFNGNLCATIVSCDSPTNASNETDINIFYDRLSPFAQHIPNHNVYNVWDVSVQIVKFENEKFGLDNLPIERANIKTDFSLENSISCLNTKFQKIGTKQWTYT